jgi:transposase
VIALRADLKVVLATQPVDFRKSVHTLSALVSDAQGHDLREAL